MRTCSKASAALARCCGFAFETSERYATGQQRERLMSGKNKVNPDHYKVAGRLSTDDLARERRRQSGPLSGDTRSRQNKPLPPWFASEPGAGKAAGQADPAEAISMKWRDADEAAQQPQGKPRPNARRKQGAGGPSQRKTARRQSARTKQDTRTGTTRGARSPEAPKAKPRSTPKASGARSTRAAAKKSSRTAKKKTR